MLENLLKYQEIDEELRKTEVELAQSEVRKKAASASAFLKAVNDNVTKLDNRAEMLVKQYDAMNKTVGELTEQLKDYDDIVCEDSDELAYIKKKAGELADRIFALSSDLESVTAEINSILKEYSSLAVKTKEAKAQYVEYLPKYNELKKQKDEETAEIKKKLAEVGKTVPKELLEKYLQKRKDKIFPVLNEARVVSKHAYCRCGTGLPDADYNYLKGGEIVECESCHRMLYLK